MHRPLGTAVLALCATLWAAPAGWVASAQDAGAVVDVELLNGQRLLGRLDRVKEREVVRLLVPAFSDATLTVTVGDHLSSDGITARVRDGAGEPITTVVVPVPAGTEPESRTVELPVRETTELVSIEVVHTNADKLLSTTEYAVAGRWIPNKLKTVPEMPPGVRRVDFGAELGQRFQARVKVGKKTGAAVRILRILGPGGLEIVPRAAKKRHLHSTKTHAVEMTGVHSLEIEVSEAAADVNVQVRLKTPKKIKKARRAAPADRDFREPDARILQRCVDQPGRALEVPQLGPQQSVTSDASSAGVLVPEGAVTQPAAVQIRTGPDFASTSDDLSGAGASVRFDAEGLDFGSPVDVDVPYDVGIGLLGDADLCVLTCDGAGNVSEVSDPVVDADAGVVTVPASHFSEFKVFQPALELVEFAATTDAYGMAALPDGTLLLAVDLGITAVSPQGQISTYAGDPNGSRADGTHRLDFAFGALTEMFAGDDGVVLVAEYDRDGSDRAIGRIFRIAADGTVTRLAGDGSQATTTAPPTDAASTGLADVYALSRNAGGDTFVLTTRGGGVDQRLWRIDAQTNVISLVSGAGSTRTAGATPAQMRLLFLSGALAVDDQDRVIVGEVDRLLRLDLDANTSETLAGDAGSLGSDPETPGPFSEGAPLRNARIRDARGLAFSGPDFLYVASGFEDGEHVLWRLDLARNRAYLVAGRAGFEASAASSRPTEPRRTISAVESVAPVGRQVFVLTFDDVGSTPAFESPVFVLRRVE